MDILNELSKAFDGGTIKDACITDEQAIISHYGLKNQIKKFNEESFELCQALITHLCGVGFSDDVVKDDITTEIADCLVQIEQFIQHCSIDRKELKKEYDAKIARQLARMLNERREHQNQ